MHDDVFSARNLAWIGVVLLLAWLQFDAMRLAFETLGLSPAGAIGLLAGCLLGSAVNVPLARLRDTGAIVAVNVGGCVLPLGVACWVAWHVRLGVGSVMAAIAVVALASRAFSRVEPGRGVTMRGFVAPLAALLAGAVIAPEALGPLAYVAGTVGTLVGADLTRLREAAGSGAATLAIGGAGTRDGIFMAGVLAVLLA